MTEAKQYFFTLEENRFVPSGLGTSPWDKRSQSGVSLAGLSAHLFESIDTTTPMMIARMTLDIYGAVPMEPLEPVIRVLRDGPRFQLVEVELRALGRTWSRATGLRVRLGESPVRSFPLTHPMPPEVDQEQGTGWFDMIRVKGAFAETGPGAVWLRVTTDMVAGHPLSPMERLAMVADLGAGFAPLVPFKEWTSANLDLAIYQTRPSNEEWLLLDSDSQSAGNGIGLATARIGDSDGMFTTTQQTTFLNRR
ncbi:MAG: thioesterase family protein [Novosphingobium sp.]|nr:thioesterase family protein [Novosphingobium sp.]